MSLDDSQTSVGPILVLLNIYHVFIIHISTVIFFFFFFLLLETAISKEANSSGGTVYLLTESLGSGGTKFFKMDSPFKDINQITDIVKRVICL